MRRLFFCIFPVMGLLMACEPPEPTNEELCEASDTCVVTADGNQECSEAGMKWEDYSDSKNFNCVQCDEGMKWVNSDPENLECEPICTYPEDFNKFGLTGGDIAPPLAWEDAYWGDGSQVPFSFEDFYCNAPADKVALVILGSTGWCPNCPQYVDHVSAMAAELNAAGAQVVYYIMQDTGGEPTSSLYAQNYVIDHNVVDDFSVRVGDATTQWIYDDGKTVEDKPGAVQYPYVPFGWMIKRDNMKVVLDETMNDPSGPGIIYMEWLTELYNLKNGDFDD